MSVKEIEDYVIAEFGDDFFRPDDDKNPRLVGSAIWYADQSLISYKISEWLKMLVLNMVYLLIKNDSF